MSNSQHRILSKLLALASESPQATRVAAAICRGSKILTMNTNNHRSKYGSHIRCAGHAEVAAIQVTLTLLPTPSPLLPTPPGGPQE